MIDRREAILSRLTEIIEALPGIAKTYRNKTNPNEGQMPAVIVFDADEEVAPIPNPERRRGGTETVFMSLQPQIIVCLATTAANVGPRLNELRAIILKALMGDTTLADLVTTNGKIVLQAVRTQYAPGRSMSAEMTIEIAFLYPLIYSEL